MFKFKDTNLPYNRRLRDSLTAIYGVGFQKSSYICDTLGLGSNYNVNLMNSYFYEAIVVFLKYYYIVDDRLSSIINQRLNFFFENRRIVGLRLSKGLPVRGQRTQTNRQNARNLKPTFFKKLDLNTNVMKKTNMKSKSSRKK